MSVPPKAGGSLNAAVKVYSYPVTTTSALLDNSSRSTDLFYVYLKSSKDYIYQHYILVFATRATSDEWWRALSTSTSPTITIKRITPQFYVYDPTSIGNSKIDTFLQNYFTQFLDKVFVTYLPDGNAVQSLSPLPTQAGPDHISGNWFFIRNTAGEYWYCPLDKNGNLVSKTIVYASTTNRTRFQVSIVGGQKGTVMIKTDKIVISPVSQLFVEPAEDQDSVLTLHKGGGWDKPTLGSFKDLFGILPPANNRGEPEVFVTADDSGVEWELV